MKTILLVALLVLQNPEWKKIACGSIDFGGTPVQSPFTITVQPDHAYTLKIRGIGMQPFYIGTLQRVVSGRDATIEALKNSDCSSLRNTSFVEMTCTLSEGKYYLVIADASAGNQSNHVAYEVFHRL